MRASYLYPSGQSTLADAKARLNIHGLWKHFNYPGDSTKNPCHSPFRKDKKESFSVNPPGTLFNDFGTGEAGDAVDFFQRATGLPQKEAFRKFIELAGGRFTAGPKAKQDAFLPAENKPLPVFLDYRIGTADEFKQLSALRNIGREGLEWANERGLLWFATLKNCPAWIISDCKRVNAQARRMDGQGWNHLEGNPKAWTLPGSWAAWPIGIGEAAQFDNIALCEGGPDFLAAHYLILHEQASHYTRRDVKCAPVAMLGASLRIHADALPLFKGKRVRIFGHDDEAGRAAVERWARQLYSVGVDNVDAFNFADLRQVDGKPVKDLNDSLSMDAASFAKTERLMPL